MNQKQETVDEQIDGLRQLIEALERRVPHIERVGEAQIAADAAALMKKAFARIAELERARKRATAPRPA